MDERTGLDLPDLQMLENTRSTKVSSILTFQKPGLCSQCLQCIVWAIQYRQESLDSRYSTKEQISQIGVNPCCESMTIPHERQKQRKKTRNSVLLGFRSFYPKIACNMIKAKNKLDILRTFGDLIAIPVSDISQPAFCCILCTQETRWTLYILTIGKLRAETGRSCC